MAGEVEVDGEAGEVGEAEGEVQEEDGEVEGVGGEAEVEEAGEAEVGVEVVEAEGHPGGRAAATTVSMFRWNQPTPQCRL